MTKAMVLIMATFLAAMAGRAVLVTMAYDADATPSAFATNTSSGELVGGNNDVNSAMVESTSASQVDPTAAEKTAAAVETSRDEESITESLTRLDARESLYQR